MASQAELPLQFPSNIARKWGFWSVLAGALALLLVFIQIVGPTFETKPSAAAQIGEIAGEIKRSAWSTFLGIPKEEAQREAIPVWNYFAIIAPVFGILAVVLSLISGLKRENWRYPVYGVSLGSAAILFQMFWLVALLICGTLLLVAIIENLGDIFSL